ncbi:hypothetical protein [Gracilimonas tropica]|uniref:hypothetical protein n=1 Tax=Gracilimonas tropica TaxID=454600 RepID=UPI000378ECDB|nr:hypothetical protein [Gracilimonas tropica]
MIGYSGGVKNFIIGIITLFFLATQGYSQGYTSPISWHHTVYETRISALGQSTAALDNGTAYQLNPAIPLERGILYASSFLEPASTFESFIVPEGAKLYSPALGFSIGRFSYSAMFDYTTFTSSDVFNNETDEISNSLLRFNIGYQLKGKFSLGLGYMYSSYKSPVRTIGGTEYGGNAKAWGINIGAFFKDKLETKYLQFNPGIGLSINNLSNGFNYENDYSEEENLPGQVRLGFGFDVLTNRSFLDRSLLGFGVYTGFSKYLARVVYDEENQKGIAPSGYKTLFTGWSSFERFNGSQMEEISLGQQISSSIGLELYFLETLYFRYGIVGGSDLWIRPQHGFGAELDFFYVTFSVSHQEYHSSDEWLAQDSSTFYQAKIKIPVDGKYRDTLLGRLMNWKR